MRSAGVVRSAVAALAVVLASSACAEGAFEGPEVVQPSGTAGDPNGETAGRPDADASAESMAETLPETSPETETTKPKPETTTTDETEPESGTTETTEEDPDDPDEQEGSDGDDSPDDAPDVPSHAERSIELVNERRDENRMPELEEDPDLTALAEGWADQMAVEGNLYHNPNLFEDRPPAYRMAGENVAYNSNPGNIDSAWWDSDGHRDNILNSSYTHMGVAFVQDGEGLWWAVQVFAG